jgi:CheY-like chemotaxis protein
MLFDCSGVGHALGQGVCCVLIVDDEPDLREMVACLLNGEGYDTVLAGNGADGLEQLRTRRPCLVLLDVMMPIMDGYEFRARQLDDPDLASIPVLCWTAMFDRHRVAQSLGVRCVQKPVSMDELLALVHAHCNPQATRRIRRDIPPDV